MAKRETLELAHTYYKIPVPIGMSTDIGACESVVIFFAGVSFGPFHTPTDRDLRKLINRDLRKLINSSPLVAKL